MDEHNYVFDICIIVTCIVVLIMTLLGAGLKFIKKLPQVPIPITHEESVEINSEDADSETESTSSEESGEDFVRENHIQTTILLTPEESPLETESDGRVMDAYKYKELDKVLRNIEERTKPITAE